MEIGFYMGLLKFFQEPLRQQAIVKINIPSRNLNAFCRIKIEKKRMVDVLLFYPS